MRGRAWKCCGCAAAFGSVVCAQPRAVIVSHVRQRGAQPRWVLFGFVRCAGIGVRLCRRYVYISVVFFSFCLFSSFLFSLTSCYLPYNTVRLSSLVLPCHLSALLLSQSRSCLVPNPPASPLPVLLAYDPTHTHVPHPPPTPLVPHVCPPLRLRPYNGLFPISFVCCAYKFLLPVGYLLLRLSVILSFISPYLSAGCAVMRSSYRVLRLLPK